MPYFKNENINLLFIHIPKTGGSSLEYYFSEKYNIPMNTEALFNTFSSKELRKKNIRFTSNSQHFTYDTIIKHKDFLGIDTNNLKILTIVRNPYYRCISELFYNRFITKDTPKKDILDKVKLAIRQNKDNHSIPQYKFIFDNENKCLLSNITILHQENLCEEMIALGYTDFNQEVNVNPNKINYDQFLTEEVIDYINNIYDKDFEYFGYIKK